MTSYHGVVLAVAFAHAPAWAQLQYVESSTGLTPPAWEKGRTTLAIADINLDGHPDILSIGDHGSPNINSQLHGVSVWFGDGAGAWSSFQVGSFGYGGIAVGDLNWDGEPDIAYGMHHDYSTTDFGDQLIEAALGDGTGMGWTPWDDGLATNGEKYGMFGVALADFDADGDLDIASNSFGCCAGVHVYRNGLHGGTPGVWTQSFGFVGGNSTQDAAAGEVNNDGYPDFAVAHQNGTVYLNNGSASFTLSDGGLPAGGLVGRRSPCFGDVNGDALDDLAFVNSAGGVEVWLRTPAGAWASASTGLPASAHFGVRLADMNSDGLTDVVAYRPTQATVWAGDGGASWTQVATIAVPSPGDYSAMAVGDIDHNGRPDVVLVTAEGAGLNPKNKLRVFRESTAPAAPGIRLISPRAGQRFQTGFASFIEWTSAVPGGPGAGSTVSLALSQSPTGPFSSIAHQIPNNGRHQQTIFPSGGLANCAYPPETPYYLRATVQTAAGSAQHVVGPIIAIRCYADCNLDGALSIADFGCFQAAFAACCADCTCDGQLSIADFACFQAAFANGCP